MKKLKLLLCACALLVGVNGAWGQASFNHTYTTGVTAADGENYFLYNIGTGQFLTSGLNYGTRATVDNAGRVLTLTKNTNGFKIYTKHLSLNNRTEGKEGYLTTNGFVDTGTNDADWVFTPVDVDGYTNAYTIKNSDTQYLFFDVANTDPGCPVNVGANTGNNYSYWLLIPKASREAAGDYSHYLINTQMNSAWEFKTWGGSTTWNDNSIVTPGGLVSNRCGEKYHTTVDIYQDIKESLPNGKYTLYVQGFYRQDDSMTQDAPVLYANSKSSALTTLSGTENNMDEASTSFTAGKYDNNSVTTIVTDNKLRVGINITGANQWVIFDNFVLDYLGTALINDAVEFTTGSTTAADMWYYYDIPITEEYEFTSSAAGTLTYTTDGTQLSSEATGTTVEFNAGEKKNISLTAGRLYFKTSAATTLDVTYKYSISEATSDVSYIQTGNTVTVSFTTSSNDPSATITQDYSSVTFSGATITVTPTASGFTFTVPTVTAATDYTLSIPAGAIKYNEDNKNAAQEITLHSPALFDGTYYFRVAGTFDGTSTGTSAAVGKYLSRGYNYGTHATIDKYGLPIIVTTDGSNNTTLQPADTRLYFAHVSSNDCYVDKAANATETKTYNIEKAGSYYRIHTTALAAGTYFKYNTSQVSNATLPVFDDGNGTNSGPIIDWATETGSEHATVMQALKDAQAASTAAAAVEGSTDYASLSGITTVSALETVLTANYVQGDFVAPSTIESVSEIYQNEGNGSQPGNANTTGKNVYENTIEITAPGFYKFSMQAFYRSGSNEVVQPLHEASMDFPPVVLFFGNQETQIMSVYDEVGSDEMLTDKESDWDNLKYNDKYYPNSTATSLKRFKADKYHNDVWFYASEAGTYTYGVRYNGYASKTAQWFIYSPESVTITSYAPAATAADYTALQNAIKAYDAATFGFDNGEYAPYNNVTVIENIAAAKAIDQSGTNSQLLVRSLTTNIALSAANVGEVNAVYNPTFSLSNNNGTLVGWSTNDGTITGNENGDSHSRAFVLTSGTNYAQLNAFGQGDGTRSAAYFRFDGTNSAKTTQYIYGATTAYTMPLKEGKYRFTAKTGGWGQTTPLKVAITDNSGTEIASQTITFTDENMVSDENKTAKDINILFDVASDGNYKLVLANGNTSADAAVAISNLMLKKAVAEDITMTEATPNVKASDYANVTLNRTFNAGWNGIVLPINTTVDAAKEALGATKIQELSSISYDEENGTTLTFAEAETFEAGKPYFVKVTGNAEAQDFTFSGVSTSDATPQTISKESSTVTYNFTGTYASKDISDTDLYFIANTTLYHVNKSQNITMKPFRAWLENKSAEAADSKLSFVFEGEESTGIRSIENGNAAADNAWYDLQGRRVMKPVKGIYIHNGKKIVK